jgi:hypothetical protein
MNYSVSRSRSNHGEVHMKKSNTPSSFPIEEINRLIALPSIWSQPPVSAEPEKWVSDWQVFKVVSSKFPIENFGFHFVGRDVRAWNGAVSSKILQFDPTKLRGVTRSGRIYSLVGMPGIDADAEYTFEGWCAGNQVVAENATEEFLQHYQVDLENIRRLDQGRGGKA